MLEIKAQLAHISLNEAVSMPLVVAIVFAFLGWVSLPPVAMGFPARLRPVDGRNGYLKFIRETLPAVLDSKSSAHSSAAHTWLQVMRSDDAKATLVKQRADTAALIRDTIFIISPNDRESNRALDILESLDANVLVADVAQGEYLGPDSVDLRYFGPSTKAVLFEQPSVALRKKLRAVDVEVRILDHHDYLYMDVRLEKPKSTLEQLMELLGWPPSNLDLLIAYLDRGAFAEINRLQLPKDLVRAAFRYGELRRGGLSPGWQTPFDEAEVKAAGLTQDGKIFWIKNPNREDHAILRFAIQSRSQEDLVPILVESYDNGITLFGPASLTRPLKQKNWKHFLKIPPTSKVDIWSFGFSPSTEATPERLAVSIRITEVPYQAGDRDIQQRAIRKLIQEIERAVTDFTQAPSQD